MTTRDRWAEWLLQRRHGGDPERRQEMVAHLAGVRDSVLDRAELAAGDTVLDVGCGDGLIAFGAIDRVGPDGKVIFSDVSAELLGVCRQQAVEIGVMDCCEFVQASADGLDAVADGSVDAITTRSVLIYVGDKSACFHEFYRVLRTGGRLSVFEPINGYPLWEADNTYCGYDVGPVAELSAKLTAV
ncbi:MAG TPA: class I SAM-dependent methyltransferase, partial [Nocardioidaceae bacterium]|nr:class I SAM-dependent methyltransferase [Nocardioidaceae bacterium]